MNRYVYDGILADALEGKSIIVVQPRRTEARSAFQAIDSLSGGLVSKVRRVNGQERIDFLSGGSVHFCSPNASGLRGRTADVAFVEGWNEMTEAQREDVAAVLASRGGELVRA